MGSFILSATDFSEASNTALAHACITAENCGSKIILLNMCRSNAELAKAKKDLKAQVSKVKTTATIQPMVRVGDFTEINQVALEFSVHLIFFGTHGARGMQKVVGSNALKLVTNSEAPFIIVQKDSPVPTDGYKNIIAPTSFHYECKQKIGAVSAISKYFDSTVYLVYKQESDVALKAKNFNNLTFMKNELENKSIRHGVKTSKGKDFNKDTLEIAKEVGADLIAIMNMQKNSIFGSGLLGDHYEQEVLMNDELIPVLIISPSETSLTPGVFAGRQ